jgi:hypothetical protein
MAFIFARLRSGFDPPLIFLYKAFDDGIRFRRVENAFGDRKIGDGCVCLRCEKDCCDGG